MNVHPTGQYRSPLSASDKREEAIQGLPRKVSHHIPSISITSWFILVGILINQIKST
jgi:hypothetical protein